MNFSPLLLPHVLDGTKTQTRRLLRPRTLLQTLDGQWHDPTLGIDPNFGPVQYVITANHRTKYCVNQSYAIQGVRGTAGIPGKRLVITRLRHEDVRTISEEDALAERCKGLYQATAQFDFWETWVGFHDPKVNYDLRRAYLLKEPFDLYAAIWDRPFEFYNAIAINFQVVEV